MNIFKILSSGDGSIKEPNVSAFLGYLLDPNKEHGFKDLLLREVLEKLNKEKILEDLIVNEHIVNLTNDSSFKVDIELEKKVQLNSNASKDIDIVITIYTQELEPLFVLCIENKINTKSVTRNQLIEQFEGIQKEVSKDKIAFIYLTPSECPKCQEEYENFKNSIDIPSLHLSWNKDIYNLFVSILDQESKGTIEPIFDYSKYTIKAFMNFIKTDFKSLIEEKEKIKKENTRYNNLEEYIKFLKTTKKSLQNTVIENLKRLIQILEYQFGENIEITYAPSNINIKNLNSKKIGKVFVYISIYTSKIKLGFGDIYDIVENELIDNNIKPYKETWKNKDNLLAIDIEDNNIEFEKYLPYFQIAYNQKLEK